MSDEISRFEALGFRVSVQQGFLILCAIYLVFGLQAHQPLWQIASWCAVVFGSILVHELGHAVMARNRGVGVGGIFIHGFGGHVTHNATHSSNTLKIALAGPGAGFLLAIPVIAVWYLVPLGPELGTVCRQVVWVNVLWGVMNLLPMGPLDGGTALRSILEMRMPMRRAGYTAGIVGLVTGIVVAVGGYLAGFGTFLPIIGGYCAYYNYQVMQRFQPA